jgi:hypothetical protein
MTSFEVLRFVHITSAILWVGGGIGLALGAEFVRHKRGPVAMFPVVDAAALMGPAFFVPISLLTLVSGATAAWMGAGFSQLWIILGLAGAIVTFLNGLLVMKPRIEEIARLPVGGQAEEAIMLSRTLDVMTLIRFDHLVLLLVVACMVLKPAPSDVGMLVGMGSMLFLGAAVTTLRLWRVRSSGLPLHRTQGPPTLKSS